MQGWSECARSLPAHIRRHGMHVEHARKLRCRLVRFLQGRLRRGACITRPITYPVCTNRHLTAQPMGVYGTSTFQQGDPVTPDAHTAPATSSCNVVSSIGNGLAVSGVSSSTTASGSASTTRSSGATVVSTVIPRRDLPWARFADAH